MGITVLYQDKNACKYYHRYGCADNKESLFVPCQQDNIDCIAIPLKPRVSDSRIKYQKGDSYCACCSKPDIVQEIANDHADANQQDKPEPKNADPLFSCSDRFGAALQHRLRIPVVSY